MNVRVPAHLKDRFATLTALPFGNLPAPWLELPMIAVGGLTNVGFARCSDLLLVLSHDGSSVIDGATGNRLARNNDESDFDSGNLIAKGIGPLSEKWVHVGGLHGGGLAATTDDGWSIERNPLSWPDDELFVFPNGHSMTHSVGNAPLQATRLGRFASEVRAFGFSPTGKVLAVATASDLTLFTR